MKYKNLVFLGTSHIAKQSLEEVKRCIEEEKPAIIALELDAKRLNALMKVHKQKIELKIINKIGLKGFIFSLLGAWAERKLGKLVGVAPGSEMKNAINIAKRKGIKIALVDQDIEVTLKRLSKAITWKEKVHFLIDAIKSFFISGKTIEFDLTTVPNKKIIKKLVCELKERYPNICKVLIEERNFVIANNIKNLVKSFPDKKILIILGAGHIDEVIGLVKEEPK